MKAEDVNGVCASCRHWQSIREGRGWCLLISRADADAKATITCELGDAIYLETAEDFGCVLWQRKARTTPAEPMPPDKAP